MRQMSKPVQSLQLAAVACIGLLYGLPEARAQSPYGVTILHSFTGVPGDEGVPPTGALTLGSDGYLYGVAGEWLDVVGNTSSIYRITTAGALTSLHVLNAPLDGEQANGGLLQGADESLYGTAQTGGPSGGGTVFKVAPDGSFSVLHNFDSTNPAGGSSPNGSLIRDVAGNLYGTTRSGGTWNGGTLFKLTPQGIFTVIASFGDGTGRAGYSPSHGVIQGGDGNWYGTTDYGGSRGWGSIFKVAQDGTVSDLYSQRSYDGNPVLAFFNSGNGRFYGYDAKSVFSISPSGVRVLIHGFNKVVEGIKPSGLLMGGDGYLYGSTLSGGTAGGLGVGTVFRMKPDGAGFTSLYSFNSVFDPGASVNAGPQGIVMDALGNLYGLAGAVFELPPPPADWGTGTPPRITISAVPYRLNYVESPNATSTISWSVSNAQACNASTYLWWSDWSGAQPLQGKTTVPVHGEDVAIPGGIDIQGGPTSYTLTCIGPTGLPAEKGVSVYSAPLRIHLSPTPG